MVFFISLLNFYILVMIFTVLIVVWTKYVDGDCIMVGGSPIGTLSKRSVWMDAFSLSWNTISTVGYGSTYPSLSAEHDHSGDTSCAFLSLLTSMEAFIGVIYAGFTGAIIFAKVTRLNQRADVKFSDCILLRYGAGLDDTFCDPFEIEESQADDSDRNGDMENANGANVDVNKSMTPLSPFPVLEFRLANVLHSVPASEIIRSQVSAVVLIEAQQDGEEVGVELEKQIKDERLKRATKKAAMAKRISASSRQLDLSGHSIKHLASISSTFSSDERLKYGTKKAGSTRILSTSSRSLDLSGHSNKNVSSTSSAFFSVPSEDTASDRTSDVIDSLSTRSSLYDKTRSYLGHKKMKIDDEEAASDLIVPRMIFCKLDLDHSDHPFFKRLWTCRHTIDGNSPLLSSAAKQRIMENGGYWPREWNNAENVRNAIRFNQIVVSFTGVSNISAANVYRQKVYDYVDVVCGFQFVNPMYRSTSGKLKVDLQLINNVVEQNNGGGEILNVIDE